MKSKLLIFFIGILILLISGCYRDSNNSLMLKKGKSQSTILQLLQQLDSLENSGNFCNEIVNNFIEEAISFSHLYPEDIMSAELLYKAGIFSMTLAKASEIQEEKEEYCKKSFAIFDDILKVYPEFIGVKNCIFNKGVIYDDILQDYENAEIFYREFIARYPSDSLALRIESYLSYIENK